jgi:hypothetical protein
VVLKNGAGGGLAPDWSLAAFEYTQAFLLAVALAGPSLAGPAARAGGGAAADGGCLDGGPTAKAKSGDGLGGALAQPRIRLAMVGGGCGCLPMILAEHFPHRVEHQVSVL